MIWPSDSTIFIGHLTALLSGYWPPDHLILTTSAVGQLKFENWPYYFSLATCEPFSDYWPPDNFTTSRFIARLSTFLSDNCLITFAFDN